MKFWCALHTRRGLYGLSQGAHSKNPQRGLSRKGSMTEPQGRKQKKAIISTKSPKSQTRKKEKSSTRWEIKEMKEQIALLAAAVVGPGNTGSRTPWAAMPSSGFSTPAVASLPRPSFVRSVSPPPAAGPARHTAGYRGPTAPGALRQRRPTSRARGNDHMFVHVFQML